jgi:hypothetical protein
LINWNILFNFFFCFSIQHYRIHCHSIGDATCSNALSAFKYVNEVNGAMSCRFDLIHICDREFTRTLFVFVCYFDVLLFFFCL